MFFFAELIVFVESEVKMSTSLSGTWSAVLSAGKTVYVSGSVTLDGPVDLSGAHTQLYITSGAVVTGLTSPVSSFTELWSYIYVESGGVLSRSTVNTVVTVVSSGGVIKGNNLNHTGDKVYAGGTALDNHKYNGGDISAGSGAVISGLKNDTNSIVYISSGATLDGSTIGSGGTVSVVNGGITHDLTIASGAHADITSVDKYPNAAVSGVSVQPVGWATISGGPGATVQPPVSSGRAATDITGTWSAVLSGGHTVYQSGATVLSGPVNLSGAQTQLYIKSGAVVTGLTAPISSTANAWSYVYVESGGTLGSSYLNTVVAVVSAGGVLSGNVLDHTGDKTLSGGTSINNTKTNTGDTSAASGSVLINQTTGNGAVVYVSSGATIKESLVTSGGSVVVSGGGVADSVGVAEGGYLNIAGGELQACFLAGTMIDTSGGPRSVEVLAIGDYVQTYAHNGQLAVAERIEWIGSNECRVDASLPDDSSGYPVCIRANAFGVSVPNSDLWVTNEHCFLFEGRYIPIRMLVNGVSIFYDKSIIKYKYYHFQTNTHSIIKANNSLTESFLNTASSRDFDLPAARSGQSWERDAAAPLDVSATFVKKIFDQITRVSLNTELAHEADVIHAQKTNDEIQVLADNGRLLPVIRRREGVHVFTLPANTGWIKIISGKSRPCDSIGPWVDDRRQLGVLVKEIILFGEEETHEIRDHLRNENLAGWVGQADGSARWTDGAAYVPLNMLGDASGRLLAINVTR